MRKLLLITLSCAIGLLIFLPITYAEAELPYDFLEEGNTLIDSNLFTQVETGEVYHQGDVNMDEFEKILENEAYSMFVNPVGLAIRLEDKASGFIWASDLVNLEDYEVATTWANRIQSSVYIEFVDDENRAVSTALLHRRSTENPIVSYSVVAPNQVKFCLDFVQESIYFEYDLYLNATGFEVAMDTSKMNEYGTNRLTKITFFQFLGAVYEDDIPGYHFVPSGNGALIRFTSSSPINSPYRARYYSQDKFRSSSIERTMLDYPVFGSVHGVDQNAFLAMITEGSEYAEYSYQPPTFQTSFHLQGATFMLRENFFQIVSGGSSVLIYEQDAKNYSPHVIYEFLKGEEANYVGMAKVFKQHLLDSGKITDLIPEADSIGIHIDSIGLEYEQGLLFKEFHKMTTVSDLLMIHDELSLRGVDNILYSMRGYNQGGLSDRSYQNYQFVASLGNVSDWEDLEVAFYYDPTVVYTDTDVVPPDTLQTIAKNPFQVSIDRGEYYLYYTDIDAIIDEFPDAFEKLNEYGEMALDGLSNEINSNKNHTRTEIISIYDQIFPSRLIMFRPSYYQIDNTKAYLLSSLYHNRSRFFTDSVPFEQIVLSGYIPTYSQYLNFSPNLNIDVLKIIDYGINPAFLITKEPSYLLSKTRSRDFYATYYGNLNDYIVDTYETVNAALQYTIGAEIVSRDVLASGIVKVDYDNGVQIYVNYTSNVFTSGDIVVEPFDYYVDR